MLLRLHRLFPPKSRVRVSAIARPLSSHSDLETLILNQYSHRRFQNILHSAIASPPFLLSASLSLFSRSNPNLTPDPDSISNRIQIRNLSLSLHNGEFNVEANCVNLLPSRKKGQSLTLPSLQLKVAIESVRIALEIIYGKRFATFAYGGRIDLGRHTAVRYLKSAENVISLDEVQG